MWRLLALFRDRRGSTAMEMAIIGPAFLMALAGAVELGAMLFASAAIDGAAREAARVIRTGQAQLSANPLATFNDRLCGKLSGTIACAEVTTDVRAFTTFASVSLPALLDQEGAPSTTFVPGNPGEVVAVRTLYLYQFVTPLIGYVLGGDSNSRWLTTTVIFRNEPYQTGS